MDEVVEPLIYAAIALALIGAFDVLSGGAVRELLSRIWRGE